MDSKINVYDLNQTKGGTDFSANDRAEVLVTNALCFKYGLDNRGGTSGFAPGYDRIINNTKVEIKISKSIKPFLEFAKADDTPAGLTATESDVHLFLNPGKTRINGEWQEFMKGRLFYTAELYNWVDWMLANRPDELISYSPSALGKGSKGFILDIKNHPGPKVEDLFVIGFQHTKNAQGHIVFDARNVIMPDSTFAYKAIKNYIA